MKELPPEQHKPSRVYLFLGLFFGLWAGAWLVHILVTGRSSNTLVGGSLNLDTYFWIVMKLLIWVAFPVVYFGRLTDSASVIGLGKTYLGKGLRYGLVGAAIWVTVVYVQAGLSHRGLTLTGINWGILLYAAVFTPAVEVLVFRGYVMSNLLASNMPFWKTNLLTSVAFLGAHVIGWTFQGALIDQPTSAGATSVVLLSLYVGYIRYKSQSLAGGYMVHAANNFVVKLIS